MDARILRAIIEKFDGGPVGLKTIAAAVGEDEGTIEEVYEPFLVQNGFLQRTPRGRVATPTAYRHFGYTPPGDASGRSRRCSESAGRCWWEIVNSVHAGDAGKCNCKGCRNSGSRAQFPRRLLFPPRPPRAPREQR